LRAKKALAGMAAGDLLTLECTDPLTAIDIPNLLRETGDKLESKSADAGLLTFRILKK
jgi:tRNA 2-thiouridine synthesizing protein A